MLKVDKFKNMDEGIRNFLQFIKSEITNDSTKTVPSFHFQDNIPKIKRTIWYLDTKDFDLKSHSFFLRVTRENNVYIINISYSRKFV